MILSSSLNVEILPLHGNYAFNSSILAFYTTHSHWLAIMEHAYRQVLNHSTVIVSELQAEAKMMTIFMQMMTLKPSCKRQSNSWHGMNINIKSNSFYYYDNHACYRIVPCMVWATWFKVWATWCKPRRSVCIETCDY